MQICDQCKTQVGDNIQICPECNADLKECSQRVVALKRMQVNPRVKEIRISIADDACPTCLQMQGVYSKEDVPNLPVHGCSGTNGCRCTYAPILEEIFP